MSNDRDSTREGRIIHVIERAPQLAQLAEFALKGHGYGDSDGGFGVVYADDLDEYAREVEKRNIPQGYVEIYGYWGASHGGYEFLAEEKEYLEVLVKVLRDRTLDAEAEEVSLHLESPKFQPRKRLREQEIRTIAVQFSQTMHVDAARD